VILTKPTRDKVSQLSQEAAAAAKAKTKEKRETEGQRPEDEKINTYITVVSRARHRFTIDINRID